MSIVLLLVLLAVVGLGAAGLAFLVALAKKGKERSEQAGQLEPGIDAGAPAGWAGDHSPEAKLHRRLVAVMANLRDVAASSTEDVDGLELRVELEQHTLDVDRRLIAAARLPGPRRGQVIAETEVSVAAVEDAAADLAIRSSQVGVSDNVKALEDLRGRIKGMTAEG